MDLGHLYTCAGAALKSLDDTALSLIEKRAVLLAAAARCEQANAADQIGQVIANIRKGPQA